MSATGNTGKTRRVGLNPVKSTTSTKTGKAGSKTVSAQQRTHARAQPTGAPLPGAVPLHQHGKKQIERGVPDAAKAPPGYTVRATPDGRFQPVKDLSSVAPGAYRELATTEGGSTAAIFATRDEAWWFLLDHAHVLAAPAADVSYAGRGALEEAQSARRSRRATQPKDTQPKDTHSASGAALTQNGRGAQDARDDAATNPVLPIPVIPVPAHSAPTTPRRGHPAASSSSSSSSSRQVRTSLQQDALGVSQPALFEVAPTGPDVSREPSPSTSLIQRARALFTGRTKEQQ